jgi:hypothetical protein
MASETEVRDFAHEQGLDKLARGRRRARHAEMLMMLPGQGSDAEERLRDSLSILSSAMNWLEGSPEFEEAHQELDAAGRIARENFPAGCQLARDGDSYAQRCPVWLAHFRMGLSPGFVIVQAECSICHIDPEECEHITGRWYDGKFCGRIITEARLLEVSLVDRPRDPDARIETWGFHNKDLQRSLGPDWKPGMPVSCDRCLKHCPGLRSLHPVSEELESAHGPGGLSASPRSLGGYVTRYRTS